jgi:glycosyltransferase involved in cell wall biosynthesis
MPVTVAGTVYDTSYGDYLKSISSGKKVTFIDTPSDRDLAELYTRSAIHVAPSVVKDYRGHFHPNSELMGITTMEALLCGTPVAVANTCSLPELISGARVGECFSNDEELELLLSRVHAGAWLSNYEPDRCSAYARERFGLAAVGRRLSESYQLALGG